MADTVQFIEEGHRYLINNVQYPSVTDVLSILSDFSRVPPDVLERKRLIGRATHKAIELHESGDLDPESVDEAVAPYLHSWIAFRTTKPLRVLAAERIVYSTRYRYAGRLDLIVEFDDDPGTGWVLDAKCVYAMSPETSLQTAAYGGAWNENEETRVQKRAGLQLKPDGSMGELYPYNDRTDFNVFLQTLNVYRWMKNHRRAT